ncbi:MAG: mechanosensitive ion channel domain-containing protein, partial [Pseudomonadota bacterium]
SALPSQLRTDLGVESVLMLYETLSRFASPAIGDVPHDVFLGPSAPVSWTVPGTDIDIVNVADASASPRYLFDADTVDRVRMDYDQIRPYPKVRGITEFDTVVVYRDGVGPILTRLMGETEGLITPEWSRVRVLRVPIWKLAAATLLLGLTLAFVAIVFWIVRRRDIGLHAGPPSLLRGSVFPISLMTVAVSLAHVIEQELRVTGPILPTLKVLWVALFTTGAIVLTVQMARVGAHLFGRIAGLQARPADQHIVILAFRGLAAIVSIGILVLALQGLGIPVSGIVTGLGLGGVAVALAAQAALQNLFGGAMLVTDRPARIGDFCRFGQHLGTLEQIGLRSSRIRSLDRSLIVIPNNELSRLEIENFQRRDGILMRGTFCLRYETTPDQLRAILGEIRRLFVAHPKVSAEPGRARLINLDADGYQIEIFTYIRTTDYNEYMALREDVWLRIAELVAAHGSRIAHSSHTIHLGRDTPLDFAEIDAAEEKVRQWRSEGRLPFPDLAATDRAAIEDTLGYPELGTESDDRQRSSPDRA